MYDSDSESDTEIDLRALLEKVIAREAYRKKWTLKKKEKKRRHEPIKTCIEIQHDQVKGFDETAEDWEEIEFLVDSGASTTVISEGEVRAVQASEPDPDRNYKMADGSLIPNKGAKKFKSVSNEGFDRWLTAQVAGVERPFLSVAQIVSAGCKVVFDIGGCYI